MGVLTTNSNSSLITDFREDRTMQAIVEFPEVVKEVLDEFAPFFTNEPERRH